jgi:leishmanolysin-like peptidase
VVDAAKKLFACSTAKGIELEDQGSTASAGSHWERALLFNEMMTASAFDHSAYSEISLALLADTGWYEVDLSQSE